MQNRIEDAYMQANRDKELLTTVVTQHITVISILAHVEDQRCLDYEQYKAIKTELSQINASLHTLAETVRRQFLPMSRSQGTPCRVQVEDDEDSKREVPDRT